MKFVNNLIKICLNINSFGVFSMAIYFIPLFDAGNGLANFSMYSASFFAWSLPRNMMDTAPYDNNQQSNSYNLKKIFFAY